MPSDMRIETSTVCWSLEKRLRITPVGVVSKKRIGARSTAHLEGSVYER